MQLVADVGSPDKDCEVVFAALSHRQRSLHCDYMCIYCIRNIDILNKQVHIHVYIYIDREFMYRILYIHLCACVYINTRTYRQVYTRYICFCM